MARVDSISCLISCPINLLDRGATCIASTHASSTCFTSEGRWAPYHRERDWGVEDDPYCVLLPWGVGGQPHVALREAKRHHSEVGSFGSRARSQFCHRRTTSPRSRMINHDSKGFLTGSKVLFSPLTRFSGTRTSPPPRACTSASSFRDEGHAVMFRGARRTSLPASS